MHHAFPYLTPPTNNNEILPDSPHNMHCIPPSCLLRNPIKHLKENNCSGVKRLPLANTNFPHE